MEGELSVLLPNPRPSTGPQGSKRAIQSDSPTHVEQGNLFLRCIFRTVALSKYFSFWQHKNQMTRIRGTLTKNFIWSYLECTISVKDVLLKCFVISRCRDPCMLCQHLQFSVTYSFVLLLCLIIQIELNFKPSNITKLTTYHLL